MRNLAILAALGLTGCLGDELKLGGADNNFKGRPLSAVTAKLGSFQEQGMIDGQKTYTWIMGNSTYECRIRVTMAGDVVDTYEGFGDINTCTRYGAGSGGLKGYGG